MTTLERFGAALDGRAHDRVPVFYQHLGAAKWILQRTGLRLHDGFFDSEIFAKISMTAHDLYGFDNVMAGWGDLLVEAQAHGAKWRFPEKDFYPRVDRYLSMDDIGKIEPVDPGKDPIWSVPLKAAKLMQERYKGEVPVVGCIDSPALIAFELVGSDNLMVGYFKEADRVDQILNVLTQSSIAYGERLVETGIDTVFIEGALAEGKLVSLSQYERFDRKYVKEVIDSYHRQGLRTILHNCAAKPFWRSQMELEPTALHLNMNAVNVPEFFAEAKGRTCVIAGIDHTELLLNHTPAEIDATVKAVIEAWGDDPRFMIAPGCELPYATPQENINALRDSVARYGSYVG